MRPFGEYSMVDVDAGGGLQVIVKELLGRRLPRRVRPDLHRRDSGRTGGAAGAAAPDHDVIYSVEKPFKDTGGLRLLQGNLAPDGGAILKVAGVEGGVKDGVFTGRARVFNGERDLIDALDHHPDTFEDNDMVVIRYVGPRGAPGMPELLDPTSRITALCRQRNITIALMTDARFSGGSVGLVIGHVAPEAFLGGPIALVEDGDTIVIDVNTDRIDCPQLADPAEAERRAAAWQEAAEANGGVHPDVRRSRTGSCPHAGHGAAGPAGRRHGHVGEPGSSVEQRRQGGCRRRRACHNVRLMQARSFRPEILVLVT